MATQTTKASKSAATKGAAAKKPAPAKLMPLVAAKKVTPTKASSSAKTSTPAKVSMPSKNTPSTKAATPAVAAPKAAAIASKAVKKNPKSNGDLSENNLPSEAELLRMPEDEYMNERQLGFFRDRLRQLEQDILNNAGATTEHLRETQFVPDPADRATIEEEHALELRTRDRERKLLKKVQQSIVRIDSGEYGWCDETGEPIGLRRLLARPTATLSLEAQERREMRQKMFGD